MVVGGGYTATACGTSLCVGTGGGPPIGTGGSLGEGGSEALGGQGGGFIGCLK